MSHHPAGRRHLVRPAADGPWTKLQENRDIDNRHTPAEFADVAIGGTTAVMYGVAVGNKTVDVNPLNGASNVDLQQPGHRSTPERSTASPGPATVRAPARAR